MSGIQLVTEERNRQIYSEGYDSNHDNYHTGNELLSAGICYANAALAICDGAPPEDARYEVASDWYFENEYFKVSPSVIRNLVKAAALLIAEIDRLQRLENNE